jgi:hypothetical protein
LLTAMPGNVVSLALSLVPNRAGEQQWQRSATSLVVACESRSERSATAEK